MIILIQDTPAIKILNSEKKNQKMLEQILCVSLAYANLSMEPL